MIMFKSSKRIVLIDMEMLFARNDHYHIYDTRQSKSLHLSVGRCEAIYTNISRSFHIANDMEHLAKQTPSNVTVLINEQSVIIISHTVLYTVALFLTQSRVSRSFTLNNLHI